MRIIVATIIWFAYFFCWNAYAEPSSFQAGVSAFNQSDYSGALHHFKAAEADGNSSLQLKFNLGSTYYKLRRYSQAENYFRQLTVEPKWRDVALLNLGLIAEKLENDELAQQYFIQSYQSTNKDSIKKIASQKMDQINVTWTEKLTTGSVSAFYGNDDNAIAFADELQSNSDAVGDRFLDLYLFGQRRVNIDDASESNLQGFVYQKTYQDLSSLDVTVIGASLIREPTNNRFDHGFSFVSSRVDDAVAYNQVQFFIGTDLNVMNRSWNVVYEPSYFVGGDGYNQLDGWQHRFSGSHIWRWDSSVVRVRLLGEINQREDLDVGTSHYSYSPKRLGVLATWRWYYSAKLNFNSTVELVASRYSGKNRLEDLDGVVKNKQRRGNKLLVELEASYLIDSRWSAAAKLEHVDNDENFDLYTYQRNQISVGITFDF